MADMNRTTKGALLGAGVGLLTGNGVNGVLKGAAVGAGVGAVTEKGRDGKNARKGAKVGAAVGAVTGVLTGNGLEGAIKGAVIGGTGGAILGKMMMKKFALLAGLFVFAPMTWAQDYNIKNGLPSETYITCAEANEMAKTDSAQVAEIVAVMGNASVASRDLKIEQSPELSAKVVEKLNQVCAKDPQMLLITAIDDTMRAIGKK